MAGTPKINANGSAGGAGASSGINPDLLKFFVALIIAGSAVALLEGVNRGAAIALTLIVVLLMFLKSPLVGWINLGSSALQKGMQ